MERATVISPSNLMLQSLNPLRELQRIGVLFLIGIILPTLIHLIPAPFALGPILMPLMIPVALAAFLLPLRSALAVAFGLPLLSLALSGMPPAPIAALLMLEGAALVAVTRTLSQRLPWWVAFLAGALANRLVTLVGLGALAMLVFPMSFPAILWSTAQGIAGLLVALSIMPFLFKLYRG